MGIAMSEGKDRSQMHWQEVLLIKKKADEGDAEAQYEIATHYDGWGYRDANLGYKPKKAFHYYKLAADQGELCAILEVGERYLSGLGTKKDSKKAFYYYKLLADSKVDRKNVWRKRNAMYFIGQFYLYGNGVDRNLKKALLYYSKAVSKAHPFSVYDPYIDRYYSNVWIVGSVVGKTTTEREILRQMEEIFYKKTGYKKFKNDQNK